MEIVATECGQRTTEGRAPVPQHGDCVRELVDLIEPVRDVDDRQTAFLQSDELRDQLGGLRLRQTGRRLVEDEDVAIAIETVERARDRDERSVDGPEMRHAFARRRLDADTRKLAPNALFFPPPSDSAASVAHITSLQREVVHDREIRDKREILVDEAQTRGSSLFREPVDVQLLAMNLHRARVQQMITGERADKRRFSRTIGAKQGANAPLRDAETHIVERERVAEALRRSGHRQRYRLFVNHLESWGISSLNIGQVLPREFSYLPRRAEAFS